MKKRLWVILGATSIIAREFAHLAALKHHSFLLVGRNDLQLTRIANDLSLRYGVSCETLVLDLSQDISLLLHLLEQEKRELDVFIAQSLIENNAVLDQQNLSKMLQTNVVNTSLIIHTYMNRKQKNQNLIFLSSVAAGRGRGKNSLYGGSKACIEIYLEGLQQHLKSHQTISIGRLGFIDTHQTYGVDGVFYAADPKKCAEACWKALAHKKERFYFPGFWRFIMMVLKRVPLVLYKRMKI